MNGSMIAIIYLVGLVLFFILLVVMTIVVIAGKSKSKRNNRNNEEKVDASKVDHRRTKQAYSRDESIFDEAENEFSDSAFDYVGTDPVADAVTEELIAEEFVTEQHAEKNISESDASYVEAVDGYAEKYSDNDEQENYSENVLTEDTELESIAAEDAALGADDLESGDSEVLEVESDLENTETAEDMLAEDLVDSAFAPERPEPVVTGLTNEEITASVREAEAMGAAVIGGMNIANVSADAIFGISEEMSKYGSKKKSQKKSNVSSDDDFYWYNKMDLAAKPSYKTAEMYYHYFNLPKDCIEDLLIEMYDCALVRTEEIRYIAYGIAPRAVSMKEILSYGNSNYVQQQKQKEPTTQDLVRIYEKWCGYVDKLFDKVEVHADDLTIDEIRKLLYEYGKSDVDVLIEGK